MSHIRRWLFNRVIYHILSTMVKSTGVAKPPLQAL